MNSLSIVTRIRERLNAVVNELVELIQQLPIRRLERDSGSIVFIAPEYYWGDLTAEQRAAQINIKRRYEPISELFQVLLHQAPEDLIHQLEDADKQFRVWLELESNWGLSSNPAGNENELRSDAAALERILAVLEAMGVSELILVPDTNSLLTAPDPVQYRRVVGHDSFTFILLPTVLGELDRLKVEHRNPDVRDKAKKIITRIKGWRQQGSLMNGVVFDKSIIIKAIHIEPDMANSLSWLDSNIADDRIIAGVLDFQAKQPSARIVLITGDINLQNKADAALIETAEMP